jgi:TRAP-type transport system periplasmic protein
MNNRISILAVCVLVLTMLLTACGDSSSESAGSNTTGNEGKEYTFKISHIAPKHHIWTPSMEKFKEELETLSEGRMTLEIYTDAVLGNDSELMDQMKAGTLDMAWINTAELTNYSKSFNAWYMPFLIDDAELAFELGETEEALTILKNIEEYGVHGLGYTFIETRGLLMKDTIVNSLEDIKGKKVRVTPSPVMIDWFETMGALPTPIPLPELFSAFQTGVVDGVDQGPVTLVGGKYFEISKNYTKSNHMIFNGAALVSQKVWNDLSEEDKKIIDDAFESAQAYNLKLAESYDTDNLKEFEDLGGKVAEIKEIDEFLDIAKSFQEKYSSEDPLIADFIKKANELKNE